jgi:hypothetical protein
MFFKLRAGFLVIGSSSNQVRLWLVLYLRSCQQNFLRLLAVSVSAPDLLRRSSWHTCRNPSSGPITFETAWTGRTENMPEPCPLPVSAAPHPTNVTPFVGH